MKLNNSLIGVTPVTLFIGKTSECIRKGRMLRE